MRRIAYALNAFIVLSVAMSLFSCDSDDSSTNPTPQKPKVDTPKVSYGSFIDSRDNKKYMTVTFNSKEWMALNLNWDGAGVCYDNKPMNCDAYGRLYTWAEVMNGAESSRANPSGVRGICPEGWHVPSDPEWTELTDAVSDSAIASDVAMTILKDKYLWSKNPGTNIYGFSVLPGGMGYGSKFDKITWSAYFWTSSIGAADWDGQTMIWARDFYTPPGNMFRTVFNSTSRFSLRCVRD